MSLKWTGNHSESGILRKKSEFKEKKEELFVFGYSCKLFRDDEKAQLIDQGKHLIPWMGDETLKIDRYDARGALHDLSALEAPPGGYDWRVELTQREQDVEALCDEERFRALHTDEDEEEMYKEEELKRLHAAGYGQVCFNYDAPAEAKETPPIEVDEPFVPTSAFKALFPTEIVMPESDKQNAIIEKTAKFIASQGAQMEILIKAKQCDNPQFKFLNRDSTLHPYYTALTALVKAGTWPIKVVEGHVEEKHPQNEDYLHPSLAATVIESAPSIPSIHYKPSADCDYTMLISKMRGETPEECYSRELAPGEVAPPGTEPLPPRHVAEITRAPVMYNTEQAPQPVQSQTQAQIYQQQYAAYYHQYMAQSAAILAQSQKAKEEPKPLKSTGLSLMKHYNTDSDSDVSDDDSSSDNKIKEPPVAKPPEDIQVVIEKMASYVARNGAEFADIVRAKGDSRFTFLEPSNVYYWYYNQLLMKKRGEAEKKSAPLVSFSIKKLKEPDPILPKPALPYESSSDDESENKETDKQTDKTEDKEVPKTNIPQTQMYNNVPPVVVYKMEAAHYNLPVVKAFEAKVIPKQMPVVVNVAEKPKENIENVIQIEPKVEVKKQSPEKRIEKKEKDKEREKYSPSKDKKKRVAKKDGERKKDKEGRDKRNRERDKREKDSERGKEKKKLECSRDELENEIISLEDNSDDLIDLTGDQSDNKAETDVEADRLKQQERRRRAAEFLKKVGVDPAAAALPTSSLASAMVDTLETIRKKKAEEEEKKRKRERKRNRDRHEEDGDRSHRKSRRRKHRSDEENEDSDHESSKKKKKKKDKKSKGKKKRKKVYEIELEEIDHPLPPNMDLSTTLKELRTSSPTKELCLAIEDTKQSFRRASTSDEDEEVNRRKKLNDGRDSSSEGEERANKRLKERSVEDSRSEDEEVSRRKKKERVSLLGDEEVKKRKKHKEDREYSEGEWSSDSGASSPSKNGE